MTIRRILARQRMLAVAALFVIVAVSPPRAATAADYPEKPITIVVPYAAGTATDISARILAEKMGPSLGQPIVIDNRAGAGGNIGSQVVAKSAPDGYRLVMGTIGSHAINPGLTPNMPYDAQRDFTPISLVTINPMLIVVSNAVPVKTLPELIEYSKTLSGGISYGSAGIGSGPHLAGEILRIRTGARLVHVPYRNAAQGVTDVVSGHLPMLIYPMPPLLPHIAKGSLRAVAALSAQRLPQLPALPTSGEQGQKDFVVDGWNALLAPAGLPRPIVDRLHAAVRVALADAETQRKLAVNGLIPVGSSPDEFRDFLAAELQRWRSVIQTTGVKAE